MPIVSVVIPVYNTEKYLSKCLDSILKQTLTDIEILCIDDGSTDDSINILRQYAQKEERVKIFSINNKGVFYARKLGLQNSVSRYVSFVDSDDWIEPDMLEIMVREIGNAELISCGIWRELPSGRVTIRLDDFKPGFHQTNCEFLKRIIYDLDSKQSQPLSGNLCNKLFLRKKLDRMLKNWTKEKISFGEDALISYLYILQCSSVVISDKCFYHYCYRENSAMHHIGIKNLTDIGQLYNILFPLYEKSIYASILLPQLQKWITSNTCFALNCQKEFAPTNIPEFIIDTNGLKNKKIALYGAGKAGKDIYRQLKYFEYEIVIWVDQNYKEFIELDIGTIKSPMDLLNIKYDLILLAAGNEKLASNMRKGLKYLGISNNIIQWRKPLVVY